ncbi:hypothetical protein ACEZCY_12445 [Streptacidiphilus sp. N1-12]|uniref:Uncharacterized protein n=2 Tax=Streptacidiphilus alkalitolerans TaxID=3342712 RepID=A0ABV6WE88_9ACTN
MLTLATGTDDGTGDEPALGGVLLMAVSVAAIGVGITLATTGGSDAYYGYALRRYEERSYSGGRLPPPHWVIRTIGVTLALAGCTGIPFGFLLLVNPMTPG